MSDLDILLEMGFPRERIEFALEVTNYKGLDSAMEWLLAHDEDEISLQMIFTSIKEEKAITQGGSSSRAQDDRSLLKEIGGEQNATTSLNCEELMMSDTEKENIEEDTKQSGHMCAGGAAGIMKKPLAGEERKEQLPSIEKRFKLKRNEKDVRGNIDDNQNEESAIPTGRDLIDTRKHLNELEMQKFIEIRNREKTEDNFSRECMKAQTEADKIRRRAQKSVETMENTPTDPFSVTSLHSDEEMDEPRARNYAKTHIQIRLYDGSTISETFGAKEQLSAVRLFIHIKTNSEMSFGLMTFFPLKIFDDEDYDKSLEDLGLMPSAVLFMTKPEVAKSKNA